MDDRKYVMDHAGRIASRSRDESLKNVEVTNRVIVPIADEI